jgi:hypothetical protein
MTKACQTTQFEDNHTKNPLQRRERGKRRLGLILARPFILVMPCKKLFGFGLAAGLVLHE